MTRSALLVASLVVVGLGAAVLVTLKPSPTTDDVGRGRRTPGAGAPGTTSGTPSADPTAPGRTPGYGFDEVALASGLDFKMSFLPEEQGPRFKINLYDHGAGVAVADYDGDGDDDVYLLNQLGPNGLFRNDGRGRFENVTAAAGVALDDRICVAATFGDVDGDGDEDLYVTSTRGGNVFFRNDGDGTFVDDTKAAGLTLVAHSEQGTFFDADDDGDLDLLVTNTAKWTTQTYDEKARYWTGGTSLPQWLENPIEKNVFYRNDGHGVFTDDTEASGLAGLGWSGDTAVFDFDEDGDQDVFVANMFGRSALYANDGKGRFTDVTKQALGKSSWGTVGAKALDYDGDGRLDLLCVDMHSDMWMDPSMPTAFAREHEKFGSPLGPRSPESYGKESAIFTRRDQMNFDGSALLFGNTLYRNLGGGRFEETSDRAGVETLWPWGIAAGDFDNDGRNDLFLASGMGYPYPYFRSPLLMGGPDGRFTERTTEAGIAVPPEGTKWKMEGASRAATRSARAAVAFDADGDGRLDLVVNTFNDRAYLYGNRFTTGHFLKVSLRGTKSNRDGVGAEVRVKVGGRTHVGLVQSAGGYLAQPSRTLHFGLGEATTIDGIEVRWPSGRVQTLGPLELDRAHEITEPAE